MLNKQNEKLLQELLKKYKQGIISGLYPGNNITFTPTGCRDKIISSTSSGTGGGIQSIQEGDNITIDNTDPLNPIVSASGGGTSTLFPNGIKYIVTGDAPAEPDPNTVYLGDGIFEYELQAGDAGKLIIIKSSDITTYLPELTPFQINENVGITSMSGVVNVKVQFAIEDDPIEMLSGAGNGCPINETVIFTNKIIDGENKIIPLSTIAIDKKTALKYLYDKANASGGSPAGSDNQIQINQSGAFFADSTFQKSDTDFNVGLDHTTQSAVTFTGSGLDDLTIFVSAFSGTYPTTYTVTVDGVNKDVLSVTTSSISGGSFVVGNTITNGLGASATIDAISTLPSDDKTAFVISSITGTFNNGDTIDNGSGVTGTQNGSVTIQDTFTWTDGTTTVTETISVDSNGILAALDTPTGHTLTDSWTWTYSKVNQNVLDFSNNDYKFQSVLGTDTFGYQISDNLLGLGVIGSANTWTTTGGDFGINGFFTGDIGLGDNTFIQWSDGYASENSTGKGSIRIGAASNTGDAFGLTGLIESFNIKNSISTIEYGIKQEFGAVTVGNLSGGNNTKITIDDVNEQITISNLSAYDDDTAAGVGGLTAGMVYMTTGSGSAPLNAAGILMIKQ